MYCQRFARYVHVTRHASERMAERRINRALLTELLEKGETRYKDSERLWIAMSVADRQDNLICAAVVLEDKLVVKTIMHHFCWEE
ncbi:DUF4258 domain-containing protein [Halomonas sp. DX6]|uniref:DUF4258 domain-containing protein n=1 Tax=Billgrantia bachuensis TaxID=2717286 RepID=A0ABX0PPL9_9GAMM|nr:DUF4258 domain-containing protein [Halomonas bachuensis]NIC04187.1 DUF4258 domain-containing protein [Halomonas bachuensis]